MDSTQQNQRTQIDLLDLEHIFSQNSLLTVDKFREACDRRGLSLLWIAIHEQLEALHRAGVLVPMYRVAKDVHALRRKASEQGLPASAVLSSSSLLAQRLHEAHVDGRVYNPRGESFVPWNRYKRMVDGVRVAISEFAYSPYQLLLIPTIRDAIVAMQTHRTRTGKYRAQLIVPERTLTKMQQERQRNDERVIALSALDRFYRPNITNVVVLPGLGTAGEEAWRAFEEGFDPVAMLTWLGWSAERVRSEAERLLRTAGSLDPLNDWLPLVRLCRPEKWDRLRDDALIAMEHRIAAEMLLLFYEDLVDIGAATPLPQIPRYASHPLQKRLKADQHALDAVLMDFGISPQPSLVLFLEGETEMEIAPRVLDRLAMRWPRNFIEIHNAQGIKANIGRIARYMVPLAFGERHGDFIELTRPATRILAVFDRENALSNDKKIQNEKQTWVMEFLKAVPEFYHTPVIQEALHAQIEVVTWNEGSFEFAHFSDEELRAALLSLCARKDIVDVKIEIWWIETARAQKQGIQTYLPNRVKRCFSKPELARELWLVLERKISVAIEDHTLDTIPIVQVLHTALDQAMMVHRSDVGMLVRQSEDRTTA